MRAAWAIVVKDVRIEWRTRESVTTIVVLGILMVVVLGVAYDPTPEEAPLLAPSVLWASFVFTGLLGVQRAFLVEREQDCLGALLAAPIDPAAIYVAKVAANVLLLASMQCVVVPLVGLVLHADMARTWLPLLVVLTLGNVGFAATATLFAAVAVRLRAREALLPLLVLPLLVPLVIAAVKATQAVLGPGGLAAGADALGVLVAFDVIYGVAGLLLFPFVVRD